MVTTSTSGEVRSSTLAFRSAARIEARRAPSSKFRLAVLTCQAEMVRRSALWAAVAAALALRARAQIASVRPIPETVKTLKQDLQWAKTQKS